MGKVNISIVAAWWNHQPPEHKAKLLRDAGLHTNDPQSKAYGATYKAFDKLHQVVKEALCRKYFPEGIQ